MKPLSDEHTITENSITISRKALEEWRDHYLQMAHGLKREPRACCFYIGMAKAFIELLKHFEE